MAWKLNILEDLKQDCSFTSIANKRPVSIQSIIDIFESYVNYDRIPFGSVLCMDEFKNLKHSSGKYAFVMYDPNKIKVIKRITYEYTNFTYFKNRIMYIVKC